MVRRPRDYGHIPKECRILRLDSTRSVPFREAGVWVLAHFGATQVGKCLLRNEEDTLLFSEGIKRKGVIFQRMDGGGQLGAVGAQEAPHFAHARAAIPLA